MVAQIGLIVTDNFVTLTTLTMQVCLWWPQVSLFQTFPGKYVVGINYLLELIKYDNREQSMINLFVADVLSTIINFLLKTPPDWDVAEKHARANMVHSNSHICRNEDNICKCCQLSYPDEDGKDLFKIVVDNDKLIDLGPGFPLYFQFMKYLCYLLVFQSLAYFIPAFVFMNLEFSEFKYDLEKDESAIGLFSLGALLHLANLTDEQNKNSIESRRI